MEHETKYIGIKLLTVLTMVRKGVDICIHLVVCVVLITGFSGRVLATIALNNIAQANNTNNTEEDVNHIVRGNELVDEALIPVYEMVKVFLEDIVQQNDLSDMEEKGVDFSDPDDILDSFVNSYEDWIFYVIGKFNTVLVGTFVNRPILL